MNYPYTSTVYYEISRKGGHCLVRRRRGRARRSHSNQGFRRKRNKCRRYKKIGGSRLSYCWSGSIYPEKNVDKCEGVIRSESRQNRWSCIENSKLRILNCINLLWKALKYGTPNNWILFIRLIIGRRSRNRVNNRDFRRI